MFFFNIVALLQAVLPAQWATLLTSMLLIYYTETEL